MKRLSLVIFSVVLAAATNVYADNLKIGIVNLDQVIQKAPLAIGYNDKISEEFKPRQDAQNTAQKKLQDNMDKLNYYSYKLGVNERTQLQNLIATEKRDFDMSNALLQRDLAAAQAQYTKLIMTKLNAVLSKIAQDGHYDLIQTTANVLFVNSTIDLTPQIIQQLK